MGLLEQEIGELRGLLSDMKAGRINPEQVNSQLAVYSQVEKRAKLILQAYALAAKHKSVLGRLVMANLIGDGAAVKHICIDLEQEVCICHAQNGETITRAKCLEFSGEDRNMESCMKCPQFERTRNRLLS